MKKRRAVTRAVAAAALAVLAACETTEQNVALGVAAVTAYLAQAPTSEITQIYYLGVFDPQDQVPPTVYRVRVRGQASWLSTTNFASGWVRAELVDSLGTVFSAPTSASQTVTVQGASDKALEARLKTGRRLVMFGPEGFREAPADHRLVIVTGSNPEKFFQAVDTVLGRVGEEVHGLRNAALGRGLLDALAGISSEQTRLLDLQKDLEVDRKVVEAP